MYSKATSFIFLQCTFPSPTFRGLLRFITLDFFSLKVGTEFVNVYISGFKTLSCGSSPFQFCLCKEQLCSF
jgi:hypothetical protein